MDIRQQVIKNSVWTPRDGNAGIPREGESKSEFVMTVEVMVIAWAENKFGVDLDRSMVTLKSRPTERISVREFMTEYKLYSIKPVKEPITDLLKNAIGSLGGLNKPKKNEVPKQNIEDIPFVPVNEKIQEQPKEQVIQKQQEPINQQQPIQQPMANISTELQGVIALTKSSILKDGQLNLDATIKLLNMFPSVTLEDYVAAVVQDPSMTEVVKALVTHSFMSNANWGK